MIQREQRTSTGVIKRISGSTEHVLAFTFTSLAHLVTVTKTRNGHTQEKKKEGNTSPFSREHHRNRQIWARYSQRSQHVVSPFRHSSLSANTRYAESAHVHARFVVRSRFDSTRRQLILSRTCRVTHSRVGPTRHMFSKVPLGALVEWIRKKKVGGQVGWHSPEETQPTVLPISTFAHSSKYCYAVPWRAKNNHNTRSTALLLNCVMLRNFTIKPSRFVHLPPSFLGPSAPLRAQYHRISRFQFPLANWLGCAILVTNQKVHDPPERENWRRTSGQGKKRDCVPNGSVHPRNIGQHHRLASQLHAATHHVR